MRVVRRLVHVLLFVLTLVVGATAAAIIVAQTAWFKDWLRGYIVREANQYLNGRLSIERLGGNLFFGVELENIGVSMDGTQLVAVKDLGIDYNVFELISRGMSVSEIRVNKPVLYLRREGDTWSITRLIKKQEQEANRQGPQFPIALDNIGISDASVVVDGPVDTSGVEVPKRFDRIDAKMSFKYEPVHYSIDIAHVSFRGSDPAIALNALSGGMSVKDDTLFVQNLALRTAESSVLVDGAVQHYTSTPILNMRISSDKLSLPEVARVVPALASVRLQPAFEISLSGPLNHLGVDMNVRSSAGQLTGTLKADVELPGQSVTGDISIRDVDLAPTLNQPAQRSDLTADARVDVKAAAFADLDTLEGRVSVTAPRLVVSGYEADAVNAVAEFQGRRVRLDARGRAYGAAATATGQVILPINKQPTIIDFRGRARNLNLARLPRKLKVPPAETNLGADYHVTGKIASGPKGSTRVDITADATMVESRIPGARIVPGSTARVSLNGRDVAYNLDAKVENVDLQKIGAAFRVPALTNERYASRLNGHLVASGAGTDPKQMELTAAGELSDSSLLGGHIDHLEFNASLSGDDAHLVADGSVRDFDPAIASGKPELKGTVAGTFDVDATVSGVSSGVTADNAAATIKATLEGSTIGGLAINWANVDGDYDRQSATIRDLEVAGRDLNVEASGTLDLTDNGQSNLTFHADTPSLDEIGKLLDTPLTGIAKIDGTVTGNRSNLQARGNLVADGAKYGDTGALSLSANYTVDVPDLQPDAAKMVADTNATFVTVAGQNVNELTAKTTYENKELAFDATAKQPQRTLGAAGSLAIHPDHQEVHLQRLTLDTQGVSWQLAPGSAPAIQYGSDTIAVQNVTLVNGDQRITAEGAFGSAGAQLSVHMNNIDLAGIDAVLLRPSQLSGRLDATSTISGTRDDPQVEAEFQVNQGGFRQFHYDAFSGNVSYSRKGVQVGARLQQNPTQWMTATGYIPLAAFTRAAAAEESAEATAERAHHEAASPQDRFDVTIDSSPIDLGLVQGLTTELANVRGTVEAHVRVTGASDDPHPEGSITLANGTARIEPTGVTYNHIAGRITLQPDRVHIDQITLLDNQQNALSVTGDLAVHERAVGGFRIYINSDDFTIIDNKMGNVRLQSSLELAGELGSPRVEGYVAMTTGRIDLDQLMAMAGTSPYPTEQTQYGQLRSSAPPPAGLSALTMDVHLTVPNDFVVKAMNLQTPGAPIGLGALNVTLGGDLRVVKDSGGQPRLTGIVNTVRGTYDFQGRRFDILRDGTVRFEGFTPPNPTLDIRTQRVIQGVEAHVNVRGTLDKPEIVLSSVPPLEQADILSLIVFNQPINQLGEGQQVSLAARAQSLATGAVAGQLAQSIGSALHLDTFEINVAPETGGEPELTLGQQVGQNVYVKVQQGIGEQSTTNFILEYELLKWLRVQTNVLQGSSTQQSLFRRAQGSGADLIFVFSY